MKFGLGNSRALLHAFENPHRRFVSIHVAGTNGKGSTSAFIASILQEAGYKTGLYTSPHLVRFTERIRINGVELSTVRLIAYVDALRPVIEEVQATFFEATTAIAFRYFADEKIDVAVVETGLGGRLDSTNVLLPIASVITTIGLDHTQILGGTIEEVAAEKGGIIKPGRVVVSAVDDGAAEKVLLGIARSRGTRYVRARVSAPATRMRGVNDGTIRFKKGPLKGIHVRVGLEGGYQVGNAQAAVATVHVLQQIGRLQRVLLRDDSWLSNTVESLGLAELSQNTGLRGRYEVVETSRGRLIFDVAHNPDAMRALVNVVKSAGDWPKSIVFGVMGDKDYVTMLRILKGIGTELVAVAPRGERPLPAGEVAKAARKAGFHVVKAQSVIRGVEIARSRSMKKPILVTGSHYVVAEALEGLKM